MPAFFAFWASSLPTSAAWSVFAPLAPRFSSQLAPASVLPATSSTSCAAMPRFERKTTRRGRSAVPKMPLRTRLWRRARRSLMVSWVIGHLPWGSCLTAAKSRSGKDAGSVRSRRLRTRLRTRPERALQRPGKCETRGRGPTSSALPDLPPDVLALVADALALVGLGRPDAPHLGCDLSHLLLVDALDEDLRRRRDLERDPGRRIEDDGMREADAELQRRPAERGTVADTLDLELLPARDLLAKLAERPVDHHAARVDRDRDTGGQFDGLSSDPTHFATKRNRSLRRR